MIIIGSRLTLRFTTPGVGKVTAFLYCMRFGLFVLQLRRDESLTRVTDLSAKRNFSFLAQKFKYFWSLNIPFGIVKNAIARVVLCEIFPIPETK